MFKTTTSLSLKVLCATALLATAVPAFAATGTIKATVVRVLMTDDDTFGGCMVLLSVNPNTVLTGCGSSWVTFSCSGDFTSEIRAYRMLDQAQLALATGKALQVWFQDDKKHNGYCFANRIDILR